jgi:hypothetical protein
MMRSATARSVVARATILTAILLVAATACGQEKSLELMMPDLRDEVPPDCTSWRELYPSFGAINHQEGYVDNGDGVISACDFITFDGLEYHIEWVGPTYHLVQPGGRQEKYLEPRDIPPHGRNPMCQMWHEVYPEWCGEWHVDGWEDDGDGVVSVCDWVFIADAMWHIEEIGLNIYAVPQSPVDGTTWGRIKSFLSDLFGLD